MRQNCWVKYTSINSKTTQILKLYLDIFNKQLHKIGIFDNIVNIISNDYNIISIL